MIENLRCIGEWTTPDSWAGKPWHGWYVGIARTRDSSLLENSNFEVFLKRLRELPEVLVDDNVNASMSYRTEGEDWSEVDSIQVVCESHWACGWIEWVAIHPKNEEALKLADEMMCALYDYPVLDESDWSEREYEAVMEWWDEASIQERVELCKEAEVSIFQARSDGPSEKVFDLMRERL